MSQLRGLDELVGFVGVWAYTRYSGQWEMSLLKLPRSVGWKFLYSEWRGSWNGMYDGRDGLSVWADTAWISTGEGSLMEMPRSVESSWIEEGRARGWTYGGRNGLRWVCTYGTSHPGRWSAQGIGRYCLWNVWVYVWNWKGKVPRSSRAELKVDRELRTSGQTEYGTTCLGRMDGISVVMRWVYAAENYPCRRSVRCKQGIGVTCTYPIGLAHGTAFSLVSEISSL
jgi:hypothetical protein